MIDIFELLMEHDVSLVSDTRVMTADSLYVLNGELTVYNIGETAPIYRGLDFEDALEWLEGREEE